MKLPVVPIAGEEFFGTKSHVLMENLMFKRFSWVFLGLALVALPSVINAQGGGIEGVRVQKPVEVRVTASISAIDYKNGVIMLGQSFSGSDAIKIVPSTKISINGASGTLNDLKVNDVADCRYDYNTRVAMKVSVTR
ncbi:MAG: hypothetical protein DWH81_15045 [Planctomycetota bacterium]|nr:MAG: hypothetical protein DWH81_15045 [Planctomycetota bacterium]